MSATKTIGRSTVTGWFDRATASRQSCSGLPPSEISLLSLSRVRRIGHHWKNVPSSPAGCSPASRACSATQPVARISSSVPASRPRIASPPIANMSRRRSVSRIASSAGAIPEEATRAGEAVADGDGAEPADEQAVATTTIATATAVLPLLLRSRADVRA